MILFDTSVLSRVFRRRRPGAEEHRLQSVFADLMAGEAQLGLPGMVLQEVLSGIRSADDFESLGAKLLSGLTVIRASVADHIEAARLRNLCLAKGVNVPGIDCLIAATAIAGRHELFAVDGDFAAIARLSPLRLFKSTTSR